MIELRRWPDNANVLIYISVTEPRRHEGTSTEGRSGDIEEHIAFTKLGAAHLFVSFFCDISYIIQSQAIEMHVLAS
jgi:hypothetical protein